MTLESSQEELNMDTSEINGEECYPKWYKFVSWLPKPNIVIRVPNLT